MANVRTIRWLAGGGFVDKEVTSGTVGQLRAELDINSFTSACGPILTFSTNCLISGVKNSIFSIVSPFFLSYKSNDNRGYY